MMNILFEKEYLIFVSTFHYFYDLVFTACVADLISICRCPSPHPKLEIILHSQAFFFYEKFISLIYLFPDLLRTFYKWCWMRMS